MKKKIYQKRSIGLAAASAVALLTPSILHAGTTGKLVTISLSGSTAMRNFTVSPGISLLDPTSAGSFGTISLNSGTLGAPITFTVANDGTSSLQLAPRFAPAIGDGSLAGNGDANGLRIEWHEQGATEGILELVNDQIGPLVGLPDRTPSSGNPTWINSASFTAAGTNGNGFTIGSFGSATGQNLVQMSISDMNARQAFSVGGSTGSFSKTPLTVATPTTGYGKGNPYLNSGTLISGLGSAGARQALQDKDTVNMAAGTFGVGPWNTANVDNLQNTQVAVTATVMAANPGTGLTKINRTDSQWLQTTGRLQNGADFNVAERDPGSGTRNVMALNTGVDPSFAVGENDGGNGAGAGATTTQIRIGSGITFSGKTAGGGQLRPTIQNARMGLGPLGMSDAIAAVKNNASTTPLRALAYADSDTDLLNPNAGSFVQPNTTTITDGSYVVWQNETYVTVKAPGGSFSGDTAAQWAARTDAETGIQGDNAGHDVADFRQNILGSTARFPNQAGVGNPTDQLLATSFIPESMVWKAKTLDGVGVATAKSANVNTDGGNFKHDLRQALVDGTGNYRDNFNTADPATVTTGLAGTTSYGNAGGGALSSGSIAITAVGVGSNAIGGNYLFGNFNQNGVRDYSSFKAAVAAQAALGLSGAGTDANSGSLNSTGISSIALSATLNAMTGFDGSPGAKKGDLIVMGDYNADGSFNGKDLYLMARGITLSDNAGTDSLSSASGATFGDRVRNVNARLNKNDALNYLDANIVQGSSRRVEARAVLTGTHMPGSATLISNNPDGTQTYTNDSAGVNAFNSYDVNRDGQVNREDGKIVDYFVGKNYHNLDHVLSAVVRTDTNDGGTIFANGITAPLDGSDPANASIPRKLINLIDVELDDTGDITGGADEKLITDALRNQGSLLYGDSDFSGTIDSADFTILAANFGLNADRWSKGDFNLDGVVNSLDFNALATFYGQSAASPGAPVPSLGSTVPEPGSLTILVAAGGLALRRRRR